MSGRCFQVGNPGISPREFTAHARMGQRDVWYGGRAQIRIGLPSNLLLQRYQPCLVRRADLTSGEGGG